MSLASRRNPNFAHLTDPEVTSLAAAAEREFKALYVDLDNASDGDEALIAGITAALTEANSRMFALDDELCARNQDWPK